MNEPHVFLRLIGDSRIFQPGQTLSGEFFVETPNPHDLTAVELSVMWHTEGKGDEDLAVHHFQRIANDSGDEVDFRRTQQFHTVLPNTPLSYDGVIVQIFWCVRLRVFHRGGRDVVAEQSFQLGMVPRAHPMEKPLGAT
jgi:hypothetical protein